MLPGFLFFKIKGKQFFFKKNEYSGWRKKILFDWVGEPLYILVREKKLDEVQCFVQAWELYAKARGEN